MSYFFITEPAAGTAEPATGTAEPAAGTADTQKSGTTFLKVVPLFHGYSCLVHGYSCLVHGYSCLTNVSVHYLRINNVCAPACAARVRFSKIRFHFHKMAVNGLYTGVTHSCSNKNAFTNVSPAFHQEPVEDS
jgi:hypothetical protein